MKIKHLPLLFLFGLMLSACSFSLAADVTPPPGYNEAPQLVETQPVQLTGPLYPLVPPDPAAGRSIYTEKCSPCHGETGKGDGPRAAQLPNPVAAIGSPDLARQAKPADWYRIVTQGNMERFMPGFTSLSDRQRWDVVAYVFSLSETDAEKSQGEALYQASCAGCHGEQGQGGGPQAGNLTTQPEDLTVLSQVVNRSAVDHYQAISEGVPPDMPAYADRLSEEQRWVLADYILWLGFSGPKLAQEQPTQAASPEPVGTSEVITPSVEVTSTAVTTATVIGSVSGQVSNASGGVLPAGATVTLYGYDNMTQAISQTTTLPESGLYKFEDVEMPAERVFIVTVDFQNTTYPSDIAQVAPDTTSINLPVEIFETTTDTSSLVVERLHLFFEPASASTLNVVELYIISNNGSKTVVAAQEGEPILNFDLPKQATNLQFQDGQLGERYVQTDTGFGDTAPIRPGNSSYQIIYQYEMPYDRKLELSEKVHLPTNAVVVLAPEGGIKITSDTLQDGGIQDVQGVQYHIYNAGSLKAGDDLKLTISGKAATGGTTLTTGNSNELIISLGALGLALIIVGVFLLQRRRSVSSVGEDEESVDQLEPESEDANTIMDGILALDDLYKAGELPEKAYLKRRAELKNRLKQVMGGGQAD